MIIFYLYFALLSPMKKSIPFMTTLAFLSALASHIALAELTLEDAIDIALRENPQLHATRQEVEVAYGRALQGRLWPNPELELTAEEVPVGSGGLSSSKNLIGLAQTIPFPGEKSLDRRIGNAGIHGAESEYLGHRAQLVRQVKEAFFRALAAQERLAVAEQLFTLAKSLVEATTKRVAAGAATDQEQLRAEVEQERAAVAWSSQRRQLTEAEKSLAGLLGQSDKPLPRLHGSWEHAANLLEIADRRAQFPEEHPDLRSARHHVAQTELELRRTKLDMLPNPSLGVAIGVDEAANETIMDVHLSFPLPLFDRAQGRRREARAVADIAGYDLTAIEQGLLEQWAVTEARLIAAAEQVETYRVRILPKAEKALQLVQRGFDAGRFGLLELLDIQRTTAEARMTYYDKLFELHAAAARLEALLPIPNHNKKEDSQE